VKGSEKPEGLKARRLECWKAGGFEGQKVRNGEVEKRGNGEPGTGRGGEMEKYDEVMKALEENQIDITTI